MMFIILNWNLFLTYVNPKNIRCNGQTTSENHVKWFCMKRTYSSGVTLYAMCQEYVLFLLLGRYKNDDQFQNLI